MEIFWEIHDGRTLMLWEDAWEQIPPLSITKGLIRVGTTMRNRNWNLVYQCWNNQREGEGDIERGWKNYPEWPISLTQEEKKKL